MQEVLFEHGYLSEKEMPTGHDDFEEDQVLTRKQKRLARRRVAHGAAWADTPEDRLNFALDCVSGRVTGEPVGLQVAVEVYGNWQRCFRTGVIRRHSAAEGELLGLHALLLVGFVRRHDKVWAVLANCWGPSFGALSPLGTPGLAEILCHGGVVFARTREEFQAMLDAVSRNADGASRVTHQVRGRAAAAPATNNAVALHATVLWGLVGATLVGFLAGDALGVATLALALAWALWRSLTSRGRVRKSLASLRRGAGGVVARCGGAGSLLRAAQVLAGAALVLVAWSAAMPLLAFVLALLLGGRAMKATGWERISLMGSALLLGLWAGLLASSLGVTTLICAAGLALLVPTLTRTVTWVSSAHRVSVLQRLRRPMRRFAPDARRGGEKGRAA